MAKVYDALRRAEEERKRRTEGEVAPVSGLDWDASPQTAPKSRQGLLGRLFRRRRRGNAPAAAADELNKRRYALVQPDSYVAEQFRTLRGRIDSLAAQRPIRTVAVTSAVAGDGKSTAAINLATVTAMGVGRQVLLIDCDMRRPTIHRSLGLDVRAGLAEVLLDQTGLDDAIVKVEGLNLDVLGVRNQPPNPSELLASSQMQSLMEEVGRRYDRVILDTPACLGLPDAKTVSELCDGLVVVVRADKTPRQDVQTALDILDRRRVLGMVLNGAEQGREHYGYY